MVTKVVEKFRTMKTPLLSILKELQKDQGYLTEEVLKEVAKELGLSPARVYGVATFYSLFSVTPKGKYIIRVCESAPCYINGTMNILEMLQDELKVDVGETTLDGLFTLELTSCLGVCGVAPAIMVNEEVYGNLDREKLSHLLSRCRGM